MDNELSKVNRLLPPLAVDDYLRLKTSIAADGQQVPILVNTRTGKVVDGFHRFQICQELGVEPLIETVDVDDKAAIRLQVSLNVARRHLSPEQKIELDLKLVDLGFNQTERAEIMGNSRRELGRLERTNIGQTPNACIPDHRVSVPLEAREEIAARVAAGEKQTQVAADWGISQQRVSQIVRQVKARQWQPEPATSPPFPDKKYNCIVIDPPWPVVKIEREVHPDQGVALAYPTMTLDEIAALPVPDSANPRGCHVYLWTTHKLLPAALGIIKSWGFRYQCLLTWVKNRGFTPFSWMYSTEHVIFARVGNLPLLRNGLRLDFTGKVREHSRKPDEFFELVCQASPGPRLEMFSRESREGFDHWGAEVGYFDSVARGLPVGCSYTAIGHQSNL